jgi:hypothetical protein
MRLPPATLNYAIPDNGFSAAFQAGYFGYYDCQNVSSLFLIAPFIELQNTYDECDGRFVDLKKDLTQITESVDPVTNLPNPPARIFADMFHYDTGAGAMFPAGTLIQNLFNVSTVPFSGVVTEHIPDYYCPSDNMQQAFGQFHCLLAAPFFNSTSFYGTPLDDALHLIFGGTDTFAGTNYLAIFGTTSCINSTVVCCTARLVLLRVTESRSMGGLKAVVTSSPPISSPGERWSIPTCSIQIRISQVAT